MKKILFIILILNFLLICQNQIEKIVIIGNTKTSRTIILKTLNHKVGDSINMDLVMDDKKKLLNLQLFNNVIVYPYDIIY
jgi:outer membrane protein assembly factor BamA